MARIILEELVPKFYDMALLEELHRHSGEKLLFLLEQEQKHLIIRTAVREMPAHQLAHRIVQVGRLCQLFKFFIPESEWFHGILPDLFRSSLVCTDL